MRQVRRHFVRLRLLVVVFFYLELVVPVPSRPTSHLWVHAFPTPQLLWCATSGIQPAFLLFKSKSRTTTGVLTPLRYKYSYWWTGTPQHSLTTSGTPRSIIGIGTTLCEKSSNNNDNDDGTMRNVNDETFATERDALLGGVDVVLVSSSSSAADGNSNQQAESLDVADYFVGNSTITTATTTPSLTISSTTGQRILQLAIPAAGALLIDPLLTVTDTALVGRYTVVLDASSSSSSAAPLAGMGSAAALLTFSFYLCNFLCTATTPLVAERRAAGDTTGAVRVAGQALSLALGLGVLLTIVLSLGQQPLLTLMGTQQTGANTYAIQFLAIRAWAAPAVLTMEAATGVLRGYLDTATPIRVLIVANVVNLVLDVVLIVGLRLGPLGAAVATTTAEWISAVLFLLVLAGRLPSQAPELGSNFVHRDLGGDDAGTTTTTTTTGTRILPLNRWPPWSEMQALLTASSSVLLRTLVLQLALSAAAATTARMSGADAAAASVAAHQIGLQLWLLCSFICDSLAAASQGLVADAIGRKDSNEVVNVASTIFGYSLVLGMALAAVLQMGASTGWILNVFTQDVATQQALNGILPLLVAAQPLNALVFAADGVLQGASQFSYQAVAMFLSGVVAVTSFVWLTETSSASSSETLVHVWIALIVLQCMRGLTSLVKLVDANGPINLLGLEKRLG